MRADTDNCLLIISPCVTLDDANKRLWRHFHDVPVGTVLNFSQASSREIKKILPHSRIIQTSKKLTEIAKWLNRRYATFISSMPRKLKDVNPYLLQAVTHHTPSSVWALSNLAEKNNKLYFGFQYACMGKLLKEEIERIGVKRVLIVASKMSSYKFFQKLCNSQHLEVISDGRKFVKKGERLIKWGKVVYRRFRTLSRFLIIKYYLTKIRQIQKELPDTLFYTQFSRTWVEEYGAFYDRFIKRLPEAISERNGETPGYLINVAGTHFVRPVQDAASDIKSLAKSRFLQGMPFFILEHYMGLFEGARLFLSLKYIFIFRQMLQLRGHSAFYFENMDMSDVIEDEIFASMQALPNNLLYLSAIRKILERHKIKILIHPFFEYSWGKAIIYGIKEADANCQSIAVQHGSFASNLLLAINAPEDFVGGGNGINIPLASAYFVDGSIIKNILKQSNYPEERLFAFGAPRFEKLRYDYRKTQTYEIEKEIEKRRNSGKKIFCLVPATNDAEEFLIFLEEALLAEKDRHKYFFLFKFSPNFLKANKEKIGSKYRFFSCFDVKITEIPTYDLMSLSDIVVTTFSTTGIEALALGKKVVCLCMPGRLNMSPLIDGADFVPTVYEPEDFTDSLEHVFEKDKMIEYAEKQLFSLDGKAADKIAEHIVANY